MRDSDGEQIDDSTHRPEDGDPRPGSAPVVRLLANPRRVRRV
jgi:hypothetical protein